MSGSGNGGLVIAKEQRVARREGSVAGPPPEACWTIVANAIQVSCRRSARAARSFQETRLEIRKFVARES
jgi:hypothetical protein